MSETEGIRTVTPQREPTGKGGMSAIGWIIFFGMFILLLPLLPFYLLLKIYNMIVGGEEPA